VLALAFPREECCLWLFGDFQPAGAPALGKAAYAVGERRPAGRVGSL